MFEYERQKFTEQKSSIRRLWNIEDKTAELLQFLVKIKSPRKVLEIGTSNGFSAFCLSVAAYPTEIHTIESDEKRYEMAKENLKFRTNVIQSFGLAETIIPELDMKFDFVFIDAGKINYIDYIKLLKGKLATNALIVADNVLSHKETTKEYIEFLRVNPEFSTMTLDIESGLEITLFNDKDVNVIYRNEVTEQ